MENAVVRSADVVCVNSEFTWEEFRSASPSLRGGGVDPVVLCLESPATESFDPSAPIVLVVSLDRFERKKDVGLLVRASAASLPPVMGGEGTRPAQRGDCGGPFGSARSLLIPRP